MAFRYRPHQGGALGLGRGGVGIRARGQQRLHDAHLARARRRHQRRQATPLPDRGIGPRYQELFDHGQARVLGGPFERGHAMIVRRGHVGAGAHQQVGQSQVIPVRGPEQRGDPIGPGGVDVDAFSEQGAHRVPIPLRRRVHQTQVRTRRDRQTGHQDQRAHPHADETGDARPHRLFLPGSREPYVPGRASAERMTI